MTVRAIAAAAASALFLLATTTSSLRSTLQSTATQYLAGIKAIAPVTGRDMAFDYVTRLYDDVDTLDQPVPAGYTQEAFAAVVGNIVSLDLDAVSQLMHRSYRPLGQIRGVGETFIRSSRDGTMQPVSVYVPTTYDPAKPAPLIVFLHGRGQTESQILAPLFIENLAEHTGTIVVAPYGRGYYDYLGSQDDIYDAYDAATKTFSIDKRRRYLAGYSMGGFSVFHVAPMHPEDWSAVMCIAGSLVGSEAHLVTSVLYTKPFYVLTGTDDDSIPTQYPTITASYLRSAGLDVSFYSQKGGLHRLVTLLPILTQAWNDMENGIVRTPPPELAHIPVPTSVPPPSLKP